MSQKIDVINYLVIEYTNPRLLKHQVILNVD